MHLLRISSDTFYSRSQNLWKSLQEALASPQGILGIFQYIIVFRISGNRFRRPLHLLRISSESSSISSFSESLETVLGDPGTSSGYPRNLPVYHRFQNLWKSHQEILASLQNILGIFLIVFRISGNRSRRSLHILKIPSESFIEQSGH